MKAYFSRKSLRIIIMHMVHTLCIIIACMPFSVYNLMNNTQKYSESGTSPLSRVMSDRNLASSIKYPLNNSTSKSVQCLFFISEQSKCDRAQSCNRRHRTVNELGHLLTHSFLTCPKIFLNVLLSFLIRVVCIFLIVRELTCLWILRTR